MPRDPIYIDSRTHDSRSRLTDCLVELRKDTRGLASKGDTKRETKVLRFEDAMAARTKRENTKNQMDPDGDYPPAA